MGAPHFRAVPRLLILSLVPKVHRNCSVRGQVTKPLLGAGSGLFVLLPLPHASEKEAPGRRLQGWRAASPGKEHCCSKVRAAVSHPRGVQGQSNYCCGLSAARWQGFRLAGESLPGTSSGPGRAGGCYMALDGSLSQPRHFRAQNKRCLITPDNASGNFINYFNFRMHSINFTPSSNFLEVSAFQIHFGINSPIRKLNYSALHLLQLAKKTPYSLPATRSPRAMES